MGPALFADANAQAQLVDNFLLRGNPGGSRCGGANGSFGKLKNGAGVIVGHPLAARRFEAAHIASDGQEWKVTASVEPGDVAFFCGGRRSIFLVPSPPRGIWLTPLPTLPISLPGALFGQTAGAPQVSPVLGNLKGVDQLPMSWQGTVREGGQHLPCSPVHVLVFNHGGLLGSGPTRGPAQTLSWDSREELRRDLRNSCPISRTTAFSVQAPIPENPTCCAVSVPRPCSSARSWSCLPLALRRKACASSSPRRRASLRVCKAR